ncbi:hypothetical protein KR018_007339 [Drosophila ironensis]|nr:hypothetical protein KR018_007339 [Drosophila ironensis]
MLWETISEENNCNMECNMNISLMNPPLFACSSRNGSQNKARRSLEMMSLDQEELCFYDDEQQAQQQPRSQSPELMGLLSPEGSPQRFQIVRKNPAPTATPARSFRVFNSLSSTCSMESSMDDEYLDLFEMEQQQQQQSVLGFPSNLNSLISGQIKEQPVAMKSPGLTMRRPSVRRCLSMTESNTPPAHQQPPKTPETARDCFKRPEPPASASCSPVQSKRHRCTEKENCPAPASSSTSASSSATSVASHPPPLRKCMSLNDAEIMSALARSENRNEPELIGDFSKTYALPLMDGRHRDLKSISSGTVARLLRGEFAEQVASYRIIDCRYPYEFEGGHIEGAKNLYTTEQILEEFLTVQQTELQQQQNAESGHKRNIIIFHCEFSSERGPKMSRFLRSLDRERNTNAYPALHYPEIYLLHNGYKEFFESHVEHCEPHAYRTMLDPAYNEAYRHFRAKSKSWNGNGDGLGGATGRLKKSRSRLML